MPGSIHPLPVMLEQQNPEAGESRQEPQSVVVRYGYQRQIAELPYKGGPPPMCGAKLVIRSPRGMELAELLTTTCADGGCGLSISRKQLLEYAENSGGKDYPFATEGRVLRVATADDLVDQAQLDDRKPQMIRFSKGLIREMDLSMRLVQIEMLLGGERIIFYYTSEQWVDFRELVRRLATEYQTRIEMHQVNAREEARLVADYEKCGRHCCCRQFLKVLRPVSMRSAKVQKATLDPAKISGRCGRLMCCLRYEDQTYEELRKRLPHRQTPVLTEHGVGVVVDTQILTQLLLVRFEEDATPVAYPLEEVKLLTKEEAEQWREQQAAAASAARAPVTADSQNGQTDEQPQKSDSRRRRGGTRSGPDQADGAEQPKQEQVVAGSEAEGAESGEQKRSKRKRRSRRRGRGRGRGPEGQAEQPGPETKGPSGDGSQG